MPGKGELRGVWRAVADSWLSDNERMSKLPREAHGNAALLHAKRSEIAAIARAVNLPYEVISLVFLEARTSEAG